MKKVIICFSVFSLLFFSSNAQDVEVYSKPVVLGANIFGWNFFEQMYTNKLYPGVMSVSVFTSPGTVAGGVKNEIYTNFNVRSYDDYTFRSDVSIAANEIPDCNKCYLTINALRITTSLGSSFSVSNVKNVIYAGGYKHVTNTTVNGVVSSVVRVDTSRFRVEYPFTSSFELKTNALVNTQVENITVKYYDPGTGHVLGSCATNHGGGGSNESIFNYVLNPLAVGVANSSFVSNGGCPLSTIVVNTVTVHRVQLPKLIIKDTVVPFNSTFNLFSLLTVAGPFLKFQGDAVNNLGIFDPNLAINSVTTITAIYNSPVGTVQRNFRIVRDDFPNVVKFPNTSPFSAKICKNNVGNLSLITSLTGVTYVGDDVVGNLFYPMRTLVVNPLVQITRKYVNSTVSTNFQVYKVDTTAIVISGVVPQICFKDVSYNLQKLVLPNFNNGSFLGFNSVLNQNIVSGNLLNVSLAGSGNFRFRFTNINTISGCSSSNQGNVVVRPKINVDVNSSLLGFNLFSNNSLLFCQNISVTTLVGISPVGGSFAGVGVSGNKWFVPSVTGIYPLSYTVIDQANCIYMRSFDVSVLGSSFEKDNSGPNSLQIFNAPVTLCGNVLYDLRNSLKSSFSTVVGVFSHTDLGTISNSTLSSSLALGSSLYKFRFVDSRDGCFVSDYNSLNVRFPIQVSISKNVSVCVSNSVVINTLVGINGSFTGLGVSSSGLFQSSTPGYYPVRYSVRNFDNCVYSDLSVVTVNSSPVVNLGQVLSICGNSLPVNLANYVLSSPVGTFTGVSIKNNVLDVTNVFYRDPTSINYSYVVVSTITGCSSTAVGSFVYLPNSLGKYFVTSFCGNGNVVLDVDSVRLGYTYSVHKGKEVPGFTSRSKFVFNYSPLDSLFYTSIKNRFGCVLSDSVIPVSEQSERIVFKDTTLMNGGYSKWPEFMSLVPTGFKFVDVFSNDSSTKFLVLKTVKNGLSNPILDVNYDFEVSIPITYTYVNSKGCLSFASQNINLSRDGKYNLPMSVNNLLKFDLSVYPNPSNSDFYISTNTSDLFEYAVYDLVGRLICSGKFVNNKLISDIYIPGIYLLEVRNIRSNEISKMKIIKN